MLLTGLTCACELREGLLLCFVEASTARRSWRMHSEPLRAAMRLCCSLLGNPGRALAIGRTGGRAGFASMLWLGLCTQTLRAACTKAGTLVQSPPQRRCRKQARIKGCWCGSKSAAPACLSSPRIPALSTSCRSQLSPRCSVALTPALLPARNAFTFSTTLWTEGRVTTPPHR